MWWDNGIKRIECSYKNDKKMDSFKSGIVMDKKEKKPTIQMIKKTDCFNYGMKINKMF